MSATKVSTYTCQSLNIKVWQLLIPAEVLTPAALSGMDYVPTLHLLNNVRSCCCCWMVLQIKLNSFPLWKHDRNAFKPPFLWVKLLKVNTETGSPITWEAIWSIWQSFPSSSLDLQFTISFFFFSRIFNTDNFSDCLGVWGGKFPCDPNARAWWDNPTIDWTVSIYLSTVCRMSTNLHLCYFLSL